MKSIPVIKLLCCSLFCFALLAVGVVWAQNTAGTISGTVHDKSGAVMPAVAVTATNEATGVVNTVQTNEAGAYSFLSLPVGTYSVEARQTGFSDYKQTGVTLDVNDHLVIDISMTVGAVSQTVEVSTNAAHVETSTVTLGDVIAGQRIVDQPLINRSYIDMMGLQAGVNPSTGLTGTVSGDLAAGNVSVSGSRTDANGFTVNGGLVDAEGGNGTSIIPNADSIAEFRIITNSANAEYGHFSGGAVNVITKSGTNSFHGDAFEFYRNQDMDAIGYYLRTKAPYNHNQFGGTLGGPIKHNRLFFFGDYQGNRESTGTLVTLNVPTAGTAAGPGVFATSDELAGNLLDRTDAAAYGAPYNDFYGKVSSTAFANVLAGRLGYAVTAGEPYYKDGCTSSTVCVFPGAIIPTTAWAPPASKLLAAYVPAPTPGVINANLPAFQSTSGKTLVHDNKGSGRVDATTGWGQLSFYYFLDNSYIYNPGTSLAGFASETPARAQQINFDDTRTFGPNSVNDFKLNFTRAFTDSTIPIGGLGVSYSSLGFVAGGNGLDAVDSAYEGVPLFSTNEFSGGARTPNAGTNNTFQFSDSYSRLHGTHQFKFGAEGNYVQIVERKVTDPNGGFSFGTNETGDDLANFLIGAVATFTQSSNQLLDARAFYYGVFAQDTWRIKPSLTLNYGLRQDVSTFFYDTQNKIQSIVPGLASQVYPGAPTGWVFPGDPGVPRTLAPTHYNNFAPRVGIAYSPNFTSGPLGAVFGPSGHTAIRAAWGIFYTIVDEGTLATEVADAPFGLYWQQNNTLFDTPWVLMNGTVQGQHFATPFVEPPPGDKNINWAFYEPIASSPGVPITDRLPYTEEYNFTIERQIGPNTTATVAYVGSQGHRLLVAAEANPGIPSICAYLSNPANLAPGSNTCGPGNENNTFTLLNGQTIYGTRLPLGDLFGAGDQYYTTSGRSTYNSLQATLRHTGKRYSLLAAYTWAKSMDIGSANGSALDPLPNPLPALPSPLPSNLFTPTPSTVTTFGAPDYNYFRALSTFDLPQDFVISYTYTLPFDKLMGHASRLTDDWKVSGTTRLATGTPITLSYGTDNSYIGTFGLDVPNFNGGNLSHLNPRTSGGFWLTCPKKSSACPTNFLYSAEPLGQIGNAMRDFIIGPGFNNTDLSLSKGITITGERQLQFRVDGFNVFNHTQFNNPSGSETSGSFMKITSAGAARIVQVGVKFVF